MTERLDDPRIQRFLGSKEVVVLATVQPDGAPLAMPPDRVMFRVVPDRVRSWGLPD